LPLGAALSYSRFIRARERLIANEDISNRRKSVIMPINGVRFGHVAFKVADTERSVRWYADAFGAQKIDHAEAHRQQPELMFLEFARGQLIELFSGGKNIL
jgi:hypothetical protein